MQADGSLRGTLLEIAAAYGHALLAVRGHLIAWAVAFLLLTSAHARTWLASSSRAFRAVAGLLLLIGAIGWAWQLASMFDDTYISLRYAANLIHGHGLVFNVGERVEGYTNFLWTLILAGGLALGIDGTRVAILGCLATFIAELLVVVRLGRLLSPEEKRPSIPIAAIVLGGSYTFATFGTSGMETMLAALLATLALERALVGRYGWSGLAGILSVLAHPDHALLYAGLGLAIVLNREARRSLWRYAAAFGLVYVPYFLWRSHYYGDWFPNTYYAKSANLSYFSQGTIYLVASGLSTGLWALFPGAAHALWRRPRALITHYTLFGAIPYLVYVAKIGGDFMLARLVVSVLPLFALLAERGWRDMVNEGLRLPSLVATALFSVVASPVRLLQAREARWYLADERTWYRVTQFWPTIEIDSKSGDRALALLDVAKRGGHPLVAEPTVGLEGYLSGLPMIDILGLTDRVIAHQPLAARGRPGHEKVASAEYLRSRGVDLSFLLLSPPAYAGYTRVLLRDRPFFLGQYKPELIQQLRSIPGAQVPDLPAILDDYLRQAEIRASVTLPEDLRFFDEFYFDSNKDEARRARFQALMAGGGGATAGETFAR